MPSGRHRDPTVGQAFADVAMLALIRTIPVSTEQALAHLHDALSARALVEQAKGVIAQVDGLDMSAAYDALVLCAEESGETLTQAARRVVGAQHREP
jgi:AmiR/NasT family two-component response regulator